MCGICGSTSRNAPVDVRMMNDFQKHRGPDDEGTYFDADRCVALGARRLSVIDIANGRQPLSNEDGSVWAVLNGEIYNSPMLQQWLRERGHRFNSYTDTETLVHLYEEYGLEFVHALDGMYAFAIWDAQAGQLILGRDRFGEKPLFVREASGVLQFASELTPLIGIGTRAPDIDPEAVDLYMVLGYVPGPRTVVRGIRQVPPGSILVWRAHDRATTAESYWTAHRSPRAGRESVEELAAETLRLLQRSVSRVLVADVSVGVFLSGGVDSTLISALVREASTQPLQTFTVGYDTGEVSEVDQAQAVARALGSEHRTLVLRNLDVATVVPGVLANLDQPLADPAVVPLHAIAKFAREHVKVAIGGEGADELFGGYPRYRWLVRSGQLKRLLPERVATVGARWLNHARPGSGSARLADVLLPQATIDRHLDWVTAHRRYSRTELYGPLLADYASSAEAIRSLIPHIDGFSEELGADAFMQLDQRHWLPDDVLFKADRAGMMNSLEIRTPYLARDVAEFANSVDAGIHLSGQGKRLLRMALARSLPGERSRRRKTAFRAPVAEWLREPLMPLMHRQIQRSVLVREGYVDRPYLERLAQEHGAGRDHASVLWTVLAMSLWLDRVVGVSEP